MPGERLFAVLVAAFPVLVQYVGLLGIVYSTILGTLIQPQNPNVPFFLGVFGAMAGFGKVIRNGNGNSK
jgi:hypothetical protein